MFQSHNMQNKEGLCTIFNIGGKNTRLIVEQPEIENNPGFHQLIRCVTSRLRYREPDCWITMVNILLVQILSLWSKNDI